MEMLENLFPVMVLSGLLPRYLRSTMMLAGLFSPKIRKGIPGFQHLESASVNCIAERKRRMDNNEPIRRDNLAKAFDLYQADLHDEKKSDRQKMLIEDVQNEGMTAM